MRQIEHDYSVTRFEVLPKPIHNLSKIHVVQHIRKNDRIRAFCFCLCFGVYLKECADPKKSFSETRRPKLSHLLGVKPYSQLVQRSNVIGGYIDTDPLPSWFCFYQLRYWRRATANINDQVANLLFGFKLAKNRSQQPLL